VTNSNPTALVDALHNLSHDNTHHSNFFEEVSRGQLYGRGIIIGIVSSFMSQGLAFESALKSTIKYLPKTLDEGCIPECWMPQYNKLKDKS
jgi:hypothetical protein